MNKMSLTVPEGNTVALVGPSGYGKSTVMSLLLRFYDLQQGTILMDNVSTKKVQENIIMNSIQCSLYLTLHDIVCFQLSIAWLRSQIGIVFQEPVLFDRTIRDNIRYGASFHDVSDDEIIDAAKIANIHDYIMTLPKVH